MAQVCGGYSFDLAFERKREVAQGLLSRAGDIWASEGAKALDPSSVLAIMLRIFLSEWSEFGTNRGEVAMEIRSLNTWLSLVGTPKQEAERFSKAKSDVIFTAISKLLEEISCAADHWSIGNPEQPPTSHVLNTIEHILFTHNLTHRPPSPKLPVTLLVH